MGLSLIGILVDKKRMVHLLVARDDVTADLIVWYVILLLKTWLFQRVKHILVGGFKILFICTPTWQKMSNLTKMGWNHQPVFLKAVSPALVAEDLGKKTPAGQLCEDLLKDHWERQSWGERWCGYDQCNISGCPKTFRGYEIHSNMFFWVGKWWP